MNCWVARFETRCASTPTLAAIPRTRPRPTRLPRSKRLDRDQDRARAHHQRGGRPQAGRRGGGKLRRVREAVGDDMDILLDCHGRLTPQMAIRYGKAFEPYLPFFMEEPAQAENPAAMAPDTARRSPFRLPPVNVSLPAGASARSWNTQAASLLQPDTCHAGGISEVRKIGRMGEIYYAGLAPHNPYGPVSTAACVQVDLVAQNSVIQEMIDPDRRRKPWPLSRSRCARDGYIERPTKPGIGVEVDEEACARRQPDFFDRCQIDGAASGCMAASMKTAGLLICRGKRFVTERSRDV